MTDLLSRPTPASPSGRPWRGASEGRPLNVTAALAALGAAGTTMVTLMGLGVFGWFLADAGAHGETTDALRVGADAWLVGHGAQLTLADVPLGIAPLGLTGLIAIVLFRSGRWAAAVARSTTDDRSAGDDRAVLLAATIFAGLYVVIVVVTCTVVTREAASPSLGQAILGSMLLSGVCGTLGLAAGAGRLRAWVNLVPGWVRSVAHGAITAFLLLVVASALLVAAALVTGLNEAAAVMSELQLSAGDYLMYALASIAIAPNAVLFGAAYLLGPGFAIGTGTVVAPSAVALGAVPAFPLLAALPGDRATPGWAIGLLAVPVVVGAVGAVLAQRAYGVTAYDSAALRGFGGGFGAALLTTIAIAAAGGPMGTGRMADIGASTSEVFVAAVMSMSLGGLVAGVVTAWWQRR